MATTTTTTARNGIDQPPAEQQEQRSQSPTPAHEWRRRTVEGELIELPGSGFIARLRRPSLTALMATTNGAPNPLSREVQRLAAAPPTAPDEEARIEAARQNSRGMVEVAAMCFVEPKFKLIGEPGEGEIGPGDLTDADYAWIYYSWVEGAVSDIAPFRIAKRTTGT